MVRPIIGKKFLDGVERGLKIAKRAWIFCLLYTYMQKRASNFSECNFPRRGKLHVPARHHSQNLFPAIGGHRSKHRTGEGEKITSYS